MEIRHLELALTTPVNGQRNVSIMNKVTNNAKKWMRTANFRYSQKRT